MTTPGTWQERYLDRFYGRRPGWKDGTREFYEMIEPFAPPGGRILEIGAGPDNPTSQHLASLGELHGLDPDPDVKTNRWLTSARVLDSERFPFDDESFDLCVSNYVIEHVADPLQHLAEVRRVLKPGGAYLFRAPNRFHYVTLFSWLTPHWVHLRLANRLRGFDDEAHDPYPTHYRLNSIGAIRRHAAGAGLEVARLELVEKEPMYGMAARPLFLAFMAYERLVNSTELLAPFRAGLLGALQRPAHPEA